MFELGFLICFIVGFGIGFFVCDKGKKKIKAKLAELEDSYKEKAEQLKEALKKGR